MSISLARQPRGDFKAGRRYAVLRKVSGELSAGLVLNASDGRNLASHPWAADSMRGPAGPHYRPADGWCIRACETRSMAACFGWIDACNDGRS